MSAYEISNSSPLEPYQVIVEPSRKKVSFQFESLWQYRELLYFLVWRDIKVRYKQTAFGAAWIVLQPVISILIFSLLFDLLLHVPSGDVPYPVFAFAALLPWTYFSTSLSRASLSVVNSANLITKVYFPRLLIPLAGVLGGLVDFAISFVVLIIFMAYYRIIPSLTVLLFPVFLLLAIITCLGFGLWLAALNVRFRDVHHLIPFIVQVWMYATPVIYSSSLIPERYRWLLGLNPMTGVVEGFRWTLLGSEYARFLPAAPIFALSLGIALIVLLGGLVFFRNTERSIADII